MKDEDLKDILQGMIRIADLSGNTLQAQVGKLAERIGQEFAKQNSRIAALEAAIKKLSAQDSIVNINVKDNRNHE